MQLLATMMTRLLLLLLLLQLSHAERQCELLHTSLTYTQEKAPRDLSGVLPVVVERVNSVLSGVVDVEVEWHGADLHGKVGEHRINCKVTRLAEKIEHPEHLEESALSVDEQGRQVATQCFVVPFTILDSNECTLPRDHVLRHKCQEPAICVNTVGSYECMCPRIKDDDYVQMSGVEDHHDGSLDVVGQEAGVFWTSIMEQERGPWELSLSSGSKTSCPSKASTHGCCPERGHSVEGQDCRSSFQCPADPCASGASTMRSLAPDNHTSITIHSNACAANAQCVRDHSPDMHPNFKCVCPPDLMGNGRACRPGIDPEPRPKVTHDGVTPTEETMKFGLYCGCTKPVVDACSAYPPCPNKHEICTVGAGNTPRCACKPGFVFHEQYGCVDKTPPILKLRHDPHNDKTLRLKQGDVYHEYAVDILDENAEDYLRSLKMTYSIPLPHGCLTHIGEFHVNYTVATPWTTPSFVRITRRVIIEDTDECSVDVAKYRESCPPMVPKCDVEAGATCVNTIGSYRCQCPQFTSGDGFLSDVDFHGFRPEGHEGGTGCRDTSVPIIQLKGPNPKIMNVCPCGGVSGVMQPKLGASTTGDRQNLIEAQRRHYGDDIKEMIAATHGAELCASHKAEPSPQPSDCVTAYDETYKGKVDLSARVEIGDPVQKSSLHWAVPYNVKDDAGNDARTVWRDVVVKETAIDEMEAVVRQELAEEHEAAKKAAVAKALEDYKANESKRHHLERSSTSTSKAKKGSSNCAACKECPTPTATKRTVKESTPQFDEKMCDKICEERGEYCKFREDSYSLQLSMFLEQIFPTGWMGVIHPLVLTLLAVGGWIVLMFVWAIFQSFFRQNSYYRSFDEAHYRSDQGAVTYYQGNTPQNGQRSPAMGARFDMNGAAAPPRASMSTNEAFFLSPPPRGPESLSQAGANGQPGTNGVHDIYESSPLITPRRGTEGLRLRSPFEQRR